jgi:hypothetical protein
MGTCRMLEPGAATLHGGSSGFTLGAGLAYILAYRVSANKG